MQMSPVGGRISWLQNGGGDDISDGGCLPLCVYVTCDGTNGVAREGINIIAH